MSFRKFALSALLLTVASATQAQTPAVAFTNPTTSNNGSGYSLGYEFTTNSSFSVSSLGYFTTGTFSESHAVGIYSSTGTLLTSATVNGSSTVSGSFAYTPITPITLLSGTEYIVTGVSGVVDPYAYNPTTFTTNPAITYVQDRYIQGSSLAFPTSSDGNSVVGYFGPNFLIGIGTSAVPEPGSVALLIGMSISGAGFLIRRKRTVK